jgi:transcription antitermination factor NusG
MEALQRSIPSKMPRWFALRTSSRSELRSSTELVQRGIETYLPACRVKRKWSDRVKVVDLPLFPGYLFARFHVNDRLKVLQTPGVLQILGNGKTPVPISENELDNLRSLVAANTLIVPWPYLRAGQRIRIERGPLTGVEGYVVRAEEGALRIVVSVDLLQRSVATEIDRDSIGSVR